MAMLNDCLYRNMGHYKFVVFSDLDEYLIPRRHRNWHEFFDDIDKKNPGNAKAWLFRNIFFKTEWPSDLEMSKNATIASLKAMSLLKVQREKTIYSPYQRSKLIIDPFYVDIIGVHNVWEFRSGATMAVLDPQDGLCHHYRYWDGLGEKEFVVDKNFFRLREPVIKILQKIRYLLI